MTTITLPPDLEGRLAEEARKCGTTPELLALESLRRLFAAAPAEGAPAGGSLHDLLAGYIGAVSGSAEALSEDGGRRFADALAAKQETGRL